MNNQLHNEIMRSLGRIEGEVKGINQRLDVINGTLKDYDKRINIAENEVTSIKAKAAMLGALLGAGVSAFWSYVKDRFSRG